MNKTTVLIAMCTLFACTEKEAEETQTFEDFQSEYFTARQGEEIEGACASWYEDCVAAGYDEEACGVRLEQCEHMDSEEREESDEDSERSDCDEAASAAYEDCIDQGISEEACRERASSAYDECANAEREE
jgi:hypothetical protein